MANTRQLCTFYLDKLLFGVDLNNVQEVIRSVHMTEVPLAPVVVTGLINLRGQIVTALDLRQRLHLDKRGADSVPVNVVVRCDGNPVSLLVDEIGDVVEVEDSTFEQAPATLRGQVRNMILGVHKLDGRLLHVLDTEKACQFERSEIEKEPQSA